MIIKISSGCTYVKLSDEPIAKTIQKEKYIIDYDAKGDLVGIEYLQEATIIKESKE